MYKALSIILALFLFILGGALILHRYQSEKEITNLNNQLIQSQQIVQETQTAYSVQAQELENLKTSNKELQKILNKKDEDILALGKVVLEWKDKYYKVLNATETTTEDGRIRVDFNQEQDGLLVTGFTLTKPAYAELKLHWTKPLTLDVILAKDKRGFYHLYIDPNNPTIIPTQLNLLVDESIFIKWYQRVSLNSQLTVGQGISASLGAGYDILDKVNLGIVFNTYYDGSSIRKLYGLNISYYPFK